MFRDILEFARQLLTLTQTTEQNKLEIKELRQELERLTAVVQRLAYEFRHGMSEERHEREKMAMRLEIQILRSDRRLPEPKQDDDQPQDPGTT